MVNIPAEVETSLSARLGEIGDQFTRELEQGQAPDIEAYLTANADLSHVLRPLLTALTEIGAVGMDQLDGGLAKKKMLGDFRIVREIARGGMGIVYEAEQVSMGRMVAIKVLPFASMIDPKPLERFRNEVRAVATLEHPHIVSVYSVGEERGVHYYAMQLIGGQSLAALIKQLQAIRRAEVALSGSSISEIVARSETDGKHPSTKDEPTTDDFHSPQQQSPQQIKRAEIDHGAIKSAHRNYYCNVARLGIQAAEALAHAHEHGIIHRDIKPSNLMLDAHGQLFVTDFGLARIEAADVTMTGDWLGTPRYMSPEQALGKRVVIDHRADIYSLGVTLYELLTLRPAFDADDRQKLLRQIASDEPTRPRQIDRHIPRDLETIVLKAISKNRDERYDTANDLAEDLSCFLEDKPIKAKPPTLMQRGTKWAIRHKPLVAAAAVILVLASLGLAISNFLIAGERNIAQQERNIARQERDESQRQEKRADENFRRAREAVDKYLTKVSEEELLDAPGLQPLRKELLELALKYYQEFTAERGDDPGLNADLAAAYFRIGEITSEIGSKEEALRAHENGLRIRKNFVAREPGNSEHQSDVANSHKSVGGLQSETGKKEEARASYEQAISIWQKLTTEIPHVDAYWDGLASAYQSLGILYYDSGNPDKAIATYQEAIRIQKELLSHDPENAEIQHDLAKSLSSLGLVKIRGGSLDEAQVLYQQAIDILSALREQEPAVAKYGHILAGCYNNIGGVGGDVYERLQWIEKAILVEEEIVEQNPSVSTYQVYLANMLNNAGRLNCTLGLREEALPVYDREIEIRKKLIEDNPTVSDYQYELACTYSSLGRLEPYSTDETEDKKLAYFKQAVAALEKVAMENPSVLKYQGELAQEHGNVGVMHERAERSGEALASYQKATDVLTALIAKDPSYVNYTNTLRSYCGRIARLHKQAGRLDEAKATYQKVIDILTTVIEKHPSNLNCKYALADTCCTIANLIANVAGDINESRKWYDRAAEVYEELIRQDPPGLKYQVMYTRLLSAIGEREKAIVPYREAKRLQPDDALTRFALGSVLQKLGHSDEAIVEYRAALRLQPQDSSLFLKLGTALEELEAFQEAIAAYRAAVNRNPDAAEPHRLLGRALVKHEQVEEAVAEYRNAVRLQPNNPRLHNELAHQLTTWADPRLRRPKEALKHAKKAVELAPRMANYWHYLGVAQYRSGDWEAAIEAFKKSMDVDVRSVGDCYNFLFLAMAHWQMGQTGEARSWYDKATTWIMFNTVDDEFTRVRAEADELGIAAASAREAPDPQPARFPVVRDDVSREASPDIGNAALVVLDDADPSFKGKPHHDSLRLLTSTGEQVWLRTGFNNATHRGWIFGDPVAIDRKRGRIYASENAADRITAFDLNGNRLWQIQQVKNNGANSLMVDDLTGNLWCSGGGETIVFDGSGNEVAAYPCGPVDMAYDPHTDAFWLVGDQILKVDRNGVVLFRSAVEGWRCLHAAVNPKDGSVWITESRHTDFPLSKNCLWLRDADGSVRHKIDMGDTEIYSLACLSTGEALVVTWKGLDSAVYRVSQEGAISEWSMEATNIATSQSWITNIAASRSSDDVWITTKGGAVIRLDDAGSVRAKSRFAVPSTQSWIAAF